MNVKQVVSAFSWLSVFVLSWLMILEVVRATPMPVLLWIFFLLCGLFSSVDYKNHQKMN